MNIPTPHIALTQLGQIAKTVIMSGDPLRIKYIADNYLERVECFNQIRGILGYNGYYHGQRISLLAHGMGIPSMGIYSHELYHNYQVDNIIRIGSAGAYDRNLNLYDVILLDSSYSQSTYAQAMSGDQSTIMYPDEELNQIIKHQAQQLKITLQEARIHCSDVFYTQDPQAYKIFRQQHNCLAVEMESFALFANAKLLKKKAACVVTIADSLVSHEVTTSTEREQSFTQMIELILEVASKLN